MRMMDNVQVDFARKKATSGMSICDAASKDVESDTWERRGNLVMLVIKTSRRSLAPLERTEVS